MASYFEIQAIGATLIYVATLLASIALIYTESDYGAAVIIAVGISIMTIGMGISFYIVLITAALSVPIGMFWISLGILVLAASSIWNAILLSIPRFDSGPSYMTFAAMLLVIIGEIIILAKAKQLFIMPPITPTNFLLYNMCALLAGSMCFLATAIQGSGWSTSVHNSTPVFGIFLFTTAGMISFFRAFHYVYGLDGVINYTAKTTVMIGRNPIVAHFITPIIGTFLVLGPLLSLLGSLFGGVDSTAWIRFTGFTILGAGFLIFGVSLIACKTKFSSVHLPPALVCTGLGCILYAIGLALHQEGSDPDEICLIIGVVLYLIGSLVCLAVLISMITWHYLFGVANYAMWGFSHITFGAVFLLAAAAGDMTPFFDNATSTVGDMFTFLGGLLLMVHITICREVTLIALFTRKDMKLAEAKHLYFAANVATEVKKSNKEKKEKKEKAPHKVVDVAIVGAGPVGLCMANALGKHGLKVLLIESRHAPIMDSRFFSLDSSTMEIYDRFGMVDKIVERGIPSNFNTGFALANQLVGEESKTYARVEAMTRDEMLSKKMDGPDDAKWSACGSSIWSSQPKQRLMQSNHEKVLLDELKSYPNVEVRYGHTLEAIDDHETHCNIVYRPEPKSEDDPKGKSVRARSRFVVGSDGPRSTCSALVGLRFDGILNLLCAQSVFFRSLKLLKNVTAQHGECLQYFVFREPVACGVFVPVDVEAGLWILHIMALWSGQAPHTLSKDQIPGILEKMVGPNTLCEILSSGNWYFNFFVARHFSKGNIFFAGDAAHSKPPMGGLGGNSGIADVNNLAWKLAAVVKGWGGPYLLESYSQERRSALLRIAFYVIKMVARPEKVLLAAQLMRFRATTWFLRKKWCFSNNGFHNGNHNTSDGIQMGTRYEHSSINYHDVTEEVHPEDPPCRYQPIVHAGCRLPLLVLPSGENLLRHLSMFDYTLLYCSPQEEPSLAINNIKDSFSEFGAPLRVVHLTPLIAGVTGTRSSYVANLLSKYCFILVRPDGYVCWATKNVELTRSQAHLVVSTCLGWSVMSRKVAFSATCASWHLTDRFLKDLPPIHRLFPASLMIVNQEKPEAVRLARARSATFNVRTKISVAEENRVDGGGVAAPSAIAGLFRRLSMSASNALKLGKGRADSHATVLPSVKGEDDDDETSSSSDSSEDEDMRRVEIITIDEENIISDLPKVADNGRSTFLKRAPSQTRILIDSSKGGGSQGLSRNDSSAGLHRSLAMKGSNADLGGSSANMD